MMYYNYAMFRCRSIFSLELAPLDTNVSEKTLGF